MTYYPEGNVIDLPKKQNNTKKITIKKKTLIIPRNRRVK